MRQDADLRPPFNEKRIKIGLIVIEMAKAVDSVNHFEPKKLVKNIKPGPVRQLSTSFAAENKKYCIIPYTAIKGDTNQSRLTLSFQSVEKHIKFGKAFAQSRILTHEPSSDSLKKFKSLSQV